MDGMKRGETREEETWVHVLLLRFFSICKAPFITHMPSTSFALRDCMGDMLPRKWLNDVMLRDVLRPRECVMLAAKIDARFPLLCAKICAVWSSGLLSNVHQSAIAMWRSSSGNRGS
jgi:hypothetical protein